MLAYPPNNVPSKKFKKHPLYSFFIVGVCVIGVITVISHVYILKNDSFSNHRIQRNHRMNEIMNHVRNRKKGYSHSERYKLMMKRLREKERKSLEKKSLDDQMRALRRMKEINEKIEKFDHIRKDISTSNSKEVKQVKKVILPVSKSNHKKVKHDKHHLNKHHAHISGNLVRKEEITYHIVFSTDCSGYQHWQAFILFYSVMVSNYIGTVTRIASGCTKEESERVLKWHTKHVADAMSEQFHIHFAPDYKEILKDNKGRHYPYFNKPFGLLHWIQDEKSNKHIHPHDIVILLDPDMILLRPFQHDYSNDARNSQALFATPDGKRKYRVENGFAFAQQYQLGANMFKRVNYTYIAGVNSPAKRLKNVTLHDALENHLVGAPYSATAHDMFHIAKKWSEFVPRVHDEFPYLNAEMFAYIIASVDLNITNQVMQSFMISAPGADGEAWSFLENLPLEDSCSFASHLNDKEYLIQHNLTKYTLPNVLHFCQRYGIGEWMWAKMRFPSNFFTCNSSLLKSPPNNVAVEYDYFIAPKQAHDEGKKKMLKTVRRRVFEAFSMCATIQYMNDASTFYKKQFCSSNPNTNWNKSMELKDVLWSEENRKYVPELEE